MSGARPPARAGRERSSTSSEYGGSGGIGAALANPRKSRDDRTTIADPKRAFTLTPRTGRLASSRIAREAFPFPSRVREGDHPDAVVRLLRVSFQGASKERLSRERAILHESLNSRADSATIRRGNRVVSFSQCLITEVFAPVDDQRVFRTSRLRRVAFTHHCVDLTANEGITDGRHRGVADAGRSFEPPGWHDACGRRCPRRRGRESAI